MLELLAGLLGKSSVSVEITGYVRMCSVSACEIVVAVDRFHIPSGCTCGCTRSRWSMILSELDSAKSSGV